MATYNKTGVVRYNVTTDTHGYPWGFRNGVNSRVVHFDLGDNTTSETKNGDLVKYDELEEMSAKYFSIRGNHDKALEPAHQDLKIAEDTANKVKFFGLDVCKTFSEFEVEIADIRRIAEELQSLEGPWDIVIFTRIPLFDGESPKGGCWTDKAPTNTKELLQLLNAYQNHTTYQINGTGTTYNFRQTNGYVIGCFAGHVHNHIKRTDFGFLMETMCANGAEEWTRTSRAQNAAFYGTPYEQHVEINFNAKTVNGVPYIEPKCETKYYDNVHSGAACDKQQESFGFLRFNSTGLYYPKFCKDGTYIGYSNASEGIAQLNGADSTWPLGGNQTLTVGGTTITTNSIRFGANGLLRYYYHNGEQKYKEFPSYDRTTVTFVPTDSDTPAQWTFRNGKYVHDKAESYKFKGASSSYPVFDARGFYLGWSNAAEGYLAGIRTATTSSRAFQLDTTTVRQDGSVLTSSAVEILFNPNGQLLSFKTSSGSYVTVSTSATATVTFTVGGHTWTFKNRKLVR